MATRRQILTTGGASLLLLGGGFGGYVATRSIAKAQQPWRRAGQGFGDPRIDALAFAILAPNPHNRQPWQVRLEGDDSFTVTCNLEKRLPHTDPPNRQITIGFGTFLELFRQAAAEKGYRAEITPFPEGEPQPVLDSRPVAHVKIVQDASIPHDSLFETILNRRSTKEPFDARAVEDATFKNLNTMAFAGSTQSGLSFETTSDESRVREIRDLAWEAWMVEYETPLTQKESIDLMRIGAREVNAKPDGIDLAGPFIEAGRIGGFVSRDEMVKKGSTAYQQGIAINKEALGNTNSYGWLVSDRNSRAAQLRTGMAWVRINQAATALGLAMHPISQILQEFPEMTELYRQFHEAVGVAAPSRVQGLFRLGYAARPEPSPRWPVESLLIDA